jgi:hypothetical protein
MKKRNTRSKARRATYAPDNPKQTRKFLEAAKGVGVDQDGKAFRQARENLRKAPRRRP